MAKAKELPRLRAEELCKKFPNSPDRTLARMLYKEFKTHYANEDSARTVIRTIRGHMGDLKRKTTVDKSLYKPITNNRNPFELPESNTEERDIWKLPKSIKKVLLLSDLHIPYHNIESVTTALQYGKKEGVDAIFLNGDILDFYQLSFHEKDPRITNIAEEFEKGRQFFKSLRKLFPKAMIYYIPGNHEYRLERYLRVKAPELLDCEEFKIDSLLRVAEYGIHYLKHGTKCYFGKLLVEHGDKMKGSGGVNPARTLFLRLKRHSICGHFHRTTENVSKVYDGDAIVTYSIGCLCELEPRYLEVNEHNHGFAIVDMNGDNFTVSNKKIVDRSVY